MKRLRRAPRYERSIVLTTLSALLPMVAIVLVFTWSGELSLKAKWTLTLAAAAAVFIGTWVLRERVVGPLRTLSNLVGALREEDFSLRARGATRDDALGDVLVEVNALGELLENRKLESVEAVALLRTVLLEIDAALFVFDAEQRLELVSRAGERLLAMPAERLMGRTSSELGLNDLLLESQTIDRRFAGASGRWNVRVTTTRQKGEPHQLLVITDITRALREEELQAWQKIVRVLSHELNNSLAPMKSVAESISSLAQRDPLPQDWRSDVVDGMAIVSRRSEALARFLRGYAQLAKLPEPVRRPVDVSAVVRRVASMHAGVEVRSDDTVTVVVNADEDQLEQALINIIKNAAEATAEQGGGVEVILRRERDELVVVVRDEGRGVSSASNLFVPFFTTKQGGTGIGLVLSRQIAEAHGGSLVLQNRADARGAEAVLRLPAW